MRCGSALRPSRTFSRYNSWPESCHSAAGKAKSHTARAAGWIKCGHAGKPVGILIAPNHRLVVLTNYHLGMAVLICQADRYRLQSEGQENVLLYKYVPSQDIARQISKGIFRFYELTKYRKLEEKTGRSDPSEGSLGFPEKDYRNFPHKLPIASFRGIEFSCIHISPDDKYLSQYFVFCASTQSSESAIDGCGYSVELDTDIFDVFEMLLPTPANDRGMKFFSHAPIEYYDVHHHPGKFDGENWKEAYIKHRQFSYQNEYRAAMFVSDQYFDRARTAPIVYRREARDSEGKPLDLKLVIQSGTDDVGWRYLELDISEFQAELLSEPFPIRSLHT